MCRLYEGEETVVARYELLLEDWLASLADGLDHRLSLEDRGIRLEMVLRWVQCAFDVRFTVLAFFVQMDPFDIKLKIPQLF